MTGNFRVKLNGHQDSTELFRLTAILMVADDRIERSSELSTDQKFQNLTFSIILAIIFLATVILGPEMTGYFNNFSIELNDRQNSETIVKFLVL